MRKDVKILRDRRGRFSKGTYNPQGKIWDKEEIDFLKNNYLRLGNCEMAKILNRSDSSITTRMYLLHLKRDKETAKNIFKKLMSGENNPLYHKKVSKKTRKKQSNSRLSGLESGIIKTWNKGLTKKNDERIKKLSKNRMGHKVTKETIIKIKTKMKGKHFSKRTEFKKGDVRISGKNNSNWVGGINKRGYNRSEFNDSLKKIIRERDDHLCQECFIKQEELIRKLDVHHIDYNKQNNSILNLISLCLYCHTKTNKDRKHWEEHFKMKMFIKELFNPQNIVAFENKKLIAMERI